MSRRAGWPPGTASCCPSAEGARACRLENVHVLKAGLWGRKANITLVEDQGEWGRVSRAAGLHPLAARPLAGCRHAAIKQRTDAACMMSCGPRLVGGPQSQRAVGLMAGGHPGIAPFAGVWNSWPREAPHPRPEREGGQRLRLWRVCVPLPAWRLTANANVHHST